MLSNKKIYSKIKIYLTGYGPFHTFTENPAEIVVDTIFKNKEIIETENTKILDKEIFEVKVDYVKEHLPLFFNKIDKDNNDPTVLNIIVHYGLADPRLVITIEKRAQNFVNDLIIKEKIDKDFPDEFIYSKLNIDSIIDIANKDNVDCKPSEDAGTYLCNYILFNSLRYYEKIDNVMATFIHIPLFTNCSLEHNLVFFKQFIKAVETIYLKDENLKLN